MAVFCLARRLAVPAYRRLRYGQGRLDCGEVANESSLERQGFASIAVAPTSLGFDDVARDPAAA